jgi:hypothetical protein
MNAAVSSSASTVGKGCDMTHVEVTSIPFASVLAVLTSVDIISMSVDRGVGNQ